MTVQTLRTLLISIPTTKTRIIITLALHVVLMLRVIFSGYQPSWDVLAYMLLMSGLDVTQYRKNDSTPSTEKELPKCENDSEVG